MDIRSPKFDSWIAVGRVFDLFTVVLILVATISAAHAQPDWQRLGPVSFTGVQKTVGTTLICCTDAGSICASTDGGLSWNDRSIAPHRRFLCLRFSDSLDGLVGASGGFVEKTTDGGRTWVEHQAKPGFDIVCIAYPSIDTAFAGTSDGACIRSVNGGVSWDTIHVADKDALFGGLVKNMVFPTSRYGLVGCAGGLVFRTTDAGSTWLVVPSPVTADITCIDATRDGREVFGHANGSFETSLDQFHGFILPFPLADSLKHSIDAIKIHNDTVFVIERQTKHRLLATFSNHWWTKPMLPDTEVYAQSMSIASGMKINDVYFDDSLGTGIAVGTYGTVYRLKNFGTDGELAHHCNVGWADQVYDNSWVYLEGLKSNPNSIHCIGNLGPYAHSSDGGVTWFTRNDANLRETDYCGLHFSSDTAGALFCTTGLTQRSFLFLNTTDDGASWRYDIQAPPIGRFHHITYSSTGNLYLGGDSILYVSKDNGFTWSALSEYRNPQDTLRTISFRALYGSEFFYGDSLIFMLQNERIDSVGVSGSGISTVIVSTNGGMNWEKRFEFYGLNGGTGFRMITPEHGFVTLTSAQAVQDSDGGQLWETLDGGYHWLRRQDVRSALPFAQLAFGGNGKYGVLPGYYASTLYHTTDEGTTWNPDTLKYPGDISSVRFVLPYFTDDSTAMISSTTGFWKKEFGVRIDAAVPAVASMQAQAECAVFPNPVNASVVHLALPPGSTADASTCESFSCYDVLGRRVSIDATGIRMSHVGATTVITVPVENLTNGIYFLTYDLSGHAASSAINVRR
jgi:photosystem II stability/assembly factor-like uncharacterized protein